MKSLLAFALCLPLLSGATAAAQEPVSEPPDQAGPFPLTRYTLSNGLRLWVQPRADSQSVAAVLVLDAGSRYEAPANNGVSHFVEHMVFTGTERWSEEEIKQAITRRGGQWNGQTGSESTTYWANVAASDLDVALDWLAQIVFHPTFPADKVDKERQVIFQEKWGRYGWIINTLDSLGFGSELDRDVHRVLFPDSSLGLRVVGEDASLDSLDREALLSYYRSHYTPDNTALIVAGGVTPEQVLASVQGLFGEIEAAGRPAAPETPRLPDSGPQRVTVRGPWPTNQVRLMVGARTVGRLHPDRAALQVLAEVLSTELTEEIRYRQGLVYGLSAYNAFFEDAGYLAVSTTSGGGSTQTIQDAAEAYIEQIGQGQVDAELVAQAKAALEGRWALAMEDNVQRAFWLAGWSAALSAGDPLPDFRASIEAVTPEDLSRVVAAYWTPERRFVGLHLPVVTVGSGVRLAAGGLALVAGVWLARRLRRRGKRRDAGPGGEL